MTDRELLELAAKAAGIDVIRPHKKGPSDDPVMDYGGFEINGHRFYWNPLIEDGDALRLAVKLGISFRDDYTYPDGDHCVQVGCILGTRYTGIKSFVATTLTPPPAGLSFALPLK